MSSQEIGALLRMCRERKGFSQSAIASQLYINRSTVSRIENGHEIPSIDLVMRWAEITDSREFIAMALVGNEAWKRMIAFETVFTQMKAMFTSIA
ncbi:hypothetical protein DNHGIG_14750 [Collibacillus ludicampi]|uniref:HTH cro/C1-type domain-containing protein n=1 Tax=Collibacillus ludicampi TaxID=2771369 RepID=A0AAV4LDW8_9BACL|nr:helix-turn-helix transcriptional regulator [Collibacillus ludicampi]GIM45926.1 hypothetical protein DNHGIG_14750 [Collibacillus ludicampi]